MTDSATPIQPQNKISNIAQLVAFVESNNNMYAIRFEQSYLNRVKNTDAMAQRLNITHTTARFLLSCSWGKYQIMGENLWNMGIRVSPIKYCDDTDMQDISFHTYCVINNCDYTLSQILNDNESRIDFATKYNGPENPDGYSKLLMNKYESIK